MNIPKLLSNYRNAILTATEGGCTLPAAAYSVLLSRFRYGLGPEFHSIFELWKKPTASWKNYIGSLEANETHKAFSRPEDQQLTNDKLAFAAHCIDHGLPTIPIICAIDSKPNPLCAEIPNGFELETWLKIMRSAPTRIFLKPIAGLHGTGAFSATRVGSDWKYLGTTGDDRALHAYCIANMVTRRGWIIQPEIRPHAEVARRFSPRALSTVRIVTYMDKDEPKLLFSVFRIPVGDNATDNWSLGLSGNLVAPIDMTDGTLGTARTSRCKTWPAMVSTDTHPDTGARIAGYKMPYWNEATELAIRAQGVFKQVPTLGWDIAITDTGPIIVETNCNYAVELIEVSLQRGIREDLAPTFSYPRVVRDASAGADSLGHRTRTA